MTARAVVVEALQAALATTNVVVMPYAKDLDNLWSPIAMVVLDKVEPSKIPQAWRDYSFSLYVVTPKTEPGRGDEELDATLEDVLTVLDEHATLTWSAAERGTFVDAWPCYTITVQLTFQKES